MLIFFNECFNLKHIRKSCCSVVLCVVFRAACSVHLLICHCQIFPCARDESVSREDRETRRCPNKSEIITTVVAGVDIIVKL